MGGGGHLMSVVVYSRLGDLLRNKKMSVHDLAGQIADQFGLDVDEHTLTRLAQATRVRRPDIELAGAAAAILEAGLNDVFAVEAVPLDTGEAAATEDETDVLSPQQSYRLRELYMYQGQRAPTEAEWAELDALVALYGRLLYEQGVRDIAATRDLPVGEAHADLATDLARIVAWRRELEVDPERKEALVKEARERQRARAVQ